MIRISQDKSKFVFSIIFLGALCFASYPMQSRSAEQNEAQGFLSALTHQDINNLPILLDSRLTVGGWASAGANYNPARPADQSNDPVSFNYRANEFNLEQLNLFIERTTSNEAGRWDIGGRFDFMFGLDTPYTQARGHWDQRLIGNNDLRYYQIALPQLYAEIYAPIANGLTAKIGHFYSIIGYESVGSPSNFFYSHSYSMKSSPFTHTGVLLSYPFQEGLTFYSGAVTGPDNFDQNLGAWSYLGGFNWSSQDKATSFALSVLNGDVSERIPDNLTYLSTVFQQKIAERWHYVLQHDHGWQANALGAGSQMATWYSIVQYLSYDIEESLGIGVRGEWFRDQSGFRYSAGPASYYEASLGLNWKALQWLTVRPEVRYDWSNAAVNAFNQGRTNDQILLGADFIISF